MREVLYDVERENIRQHGYGMHSFALALVKCFEQLSVEPLTPALHETIHGFAYAIADHPMEILPDVPETLADLAQRHRLFLVTKGNITEQSGKVERSGLKEYFTAVEVVAEKDAATYSGVVEKYGLLRESTWMIGNSPKSDINPALEAGLARGVCAAPQHLDAGARRVVPGNWQRSAVAGGELRKVAGSILMLNHRGTETQRSTAGHCTFLS